MKAFFLFYGRGGCLEGMSACLSVEGAGAGVVVGGGGATVSFSDTLDHREAQRAPPPAPDPLSPACRWEQSGAKFRPLFWLRDPTTTTTNPPSSPSLSCTTSLSSSITHTNKENFSTITTVSALRVSPALPPHRPTVTTTPSWFMSELMKKDSIKLLSGGRVGGWGA